MTFIMNRNWLVLSSILALGLASCSGDKKPDTEAFLKSLDSLKVETPAISEEVISDILGQIPSPLEISVLLKQSGNAYDKSMLSTVAGADNYNTSYKRALNLGIYGTDLGYTNIFEQNQDGLDYMGAIKNLADGLNIGRFFDIRALGRLATNSKNLDSLLLITTQNFNDINTYLQQQKRSNLSILFLAGGWLEALHITCQVASSAAEPEELHEKIGEQKIILEQVMLLLSFDSESDPNIKGLVEDMRSLQNAYEDIEIITTYAESTMEVIDGVLIIKDNNTSTIIITPENVEEIKNSISAIRKNIIA